ncbi:hypothetical protein RUND412_011690 [Rhizina undulata]
MSKRLRVRDEPLSKQQKDLKESEHILYYQIAVKISWKVKNHQEQVHVAKHKIPTISHGSPIQVPGPDRIQIEGTGLRFNMSLDLVISKHEEIMS